jgi:hypothetical protein
MAVVTRANIKVVIRHQAAFVCHGRGAIMPFLKGYAFFWTFCLFFLFLKVVAFFSRFFIATLFVRPMDFYASHMRFLSVLYHGQFFFHFSETEKIV